jgi:hypothetical protein
MRKLTTFCRVHSLTVRGVPPGYWSGVRHRKVGRQHLLETSLVRLSDFGATALMRLPSTYFFSSRSSTYPALYCSYRLHRELPDLSKLDVARFNQDIMLT